MMTVAPSVQGIIETAISVADVPASAAFYRRLFDCSVLFESERLVALGVAGKSVLLIFQAGGTDASVETPGGTIPGHRGIGQSHFAFSIADDQFEPWRRKLIEERVPIESEVNWPGGARSLYFRDLDQHLVELLTPGFWKLG